MRIHIRFVRSGYSVSTLSYFTLPPSIFNLANCMMFVVSLYILVSEARASPWTSRESHVRLVVVLNKSGELAFSSIPSISYTNTHWIPTPFCLYLYNIYIYIYISTYTSLVIPINSIYPPYISVRYPYILKSLLWSFLHAAKRQGR